VVVRCQRTDQRQRHRADLPAGHAGRQCRTVCLATVYAASRVPAVLVYLRLHRRHVEHLVANRLVGQHLHRCATFADLHRLAVDDAVDLRFFQQCARAALVARLRPALALAGAALRSLAAGQSVR
jgi:hypothetical protein